MVLATFLYLGGCGGKNGTTIDGTTIDGGTETDATSDDDGGNGDDGGVADGFLPIHIVLDVHIEDMGENGGQLDMAEYEKRRTEVLWLLDTAESYGAKLSLQSNGEYMEYCLELGHEDDFHQYISGGHHVGTHAHPFYCEGEHDWRRADPNADLDQLRRVWTDNKNAVDEVLTAAGHDPATINTVMCAQRPSDFADNEILMQEYDFAIEGGGRNEFFYDFYGHGVFSAWRPGGQSALDEDLEQRQFVAVPHTSQIGEQTEHGPPGERHYMDNTVPALKKRFLMLYLEWLHQERSGGQPKVWVYGFATHAQAAAIPYLNVHDDVEEMLQWWQENFVDVESARGNVIARFATVQEVHDQYIAWEQRHPSTSSFEYHDGDPYPYSMEVLAERLWDKKDGQTSGYVAALDTWADQGISCHELSYQQTPTANERPLYILWKNAGETDIDFSSVLSGTLTITDLLDGSQSQSDAQSLHVTERPLLVEQP